MATNAYPNAYADPQDGIGKTYAVEDNRKATVKTQPTDVRAEAAYILEETGDHSKKYKIVKAPDAALVDTFTFDPYRFAEAHEADHVLVQSFSGAFERVNWTNVGDLHPRP